MWNRGTNRGEIRICSLLGIRRKATRTLMLDEALLEASSRSENSTSVRIVWVICTTISKMVLIPFVICEVANVLSLTRYLRNMCYFFLFCVCVCVSFLQRHPCASMFWSSLSSSSQLSLSLLSHCHYWLRSGDSTIGFTISNRIWLTGETA